MNSTIALFLLVILTGCTSTKNTQRVNDLNPGMTKAEALAVMGPPTTSMSPGNGVEILKWTFKKQRLYRLAVPLKTDFIVRLEQGRVAAYGTERDLKPAAPVAPVVVLSNEKTVNVNIKSDGNTNAVAPLKPRLNINAD